MDPLVVAVLGVVAIVAVSALAPRVGVAAPLVLVLLGVAVSFLPFVPAIDVDPELILGGVLPPLLYSSAVGMPTMDFRRDFRIISTLSVVLVVVSAVVVGFVVSWLVPDLGLAAGIALGAIVSPTDAVATSIVRRAGVSARIVTVLEGESMLNDASALVLLRAAIAALGASVALLDVAVDFLWAVVVAAAIGFAVGKLNLLVRSFLDQPAASVAVSFVVPFAAYLPAEHVEASGLVAAVVAGLVSGSGAAKRLSAQDRITERVVWATIELLLESAVFLLMGLQLFGLVEDLAGEGESLLGALAIGGVAALVVILVRTVLVAPSVWALALRARRNPQVRERLSDFQDKLAHGDVQAPPPRRRVDPEKYARRVENRLRRLGTTLTQRIADIDYLTAEQFGWREAVVLVWAGMRGAVTLAAAQSLPAQTPHRSLLIVAAFAVAAGTLLVQGGTLPAVVRWLRLGERDDEADASEHEALRRELMRSSLDRLDRADLRRPDGTPYSESTLTRIRELGLLPRREDEVADGEDTGRALSPRLGEEIRDLRLTLITAQRAALLRIRDVGTYRSSVLDDALVQLDAAEIGIRLRERRD
jgi:CPA1 family monovalent cation:H+ antiporter